MSAGAIIAIAAAALVLFAVVLVVTTARRADQRAATGVLSRETRKRDKGAVATSGTAAPTGKEVELAASRTDVAVATPQAPVPFTPIDPELVGFNRRQFLNRGMFAMMNVSLIGFGGACLAFLWKGADGGFGSKINIGKLDDVKAAIAANDGFYYVPEGKAWLTAYPPDGLPKAKKIYDATVYGGMEAGIVALYQKCVHLGCRVPECKTSQWFECPCHGSQYNRVGEKKGGPAPRGLDRFAVEISGGEIVVNTGLIVQGPPIGTNTTGQEAEGPHCIGGGEGSH
jgi:cytochrome b6-f complex iron-sulfur subunit